MSGPLPGSPPPKLQEAYGALAPDARSAVLPHLIGDTSADYLSGWFSRYGAPVGATTIKAYRRANAEGSV